MTIAGSKTPQSASTNGHDYSLPPHGYLSQRSQSSQGNQTTQTKDWELLDKKSPGRPGAFSFVGEGIQDVRYEMWDVRW